MRAAIFAAVAALLLGACATDILTPRERAMMAGRYGELERVSQAEVPQLAGARTVKLAHLCFAYAKQKKYAQLWPCVEQLEKNVAAGDTNMYDAEAAAAKSPLLMGLARIGSVFAGVSLEQDVTPHLWELRVETALELGDYRQAQRYADKLMTYKTTQWNLERYQRIHSLGMHALVLALAGEREAAQQRASELEAVGTGYPHVMLKTDKLVFLARVYLALGEYERAYRIISEDDNAFFRGLADVVSGGATLEGGSLYAFQQLQRRFMRHKSEMETGRLNEARAGYDALLAEPATQENGDFHWIVLYDRGRIAGREGKLDEAVNFFRRAIEVIERQRSSLSTEASKIGFIGTRQGVYQELVSTLATQGRAAEAFDYVERAKARALVDMLAAKQDFAVAGADAREIAALLAGAAEAEAEARTLAPAGARTRGGLERTRAQLAAQAPELASLVQVSALALGEVQQRLGGEERLIEYYLGAGERLHAFVVSARELTLHTLDGKGLEAEVARLRAALDRPAGEAWRESAQRLHGRLIAPLAARLEAPGEAPPLTVVAHGALHYLPFAALHDGRQFLVERHRLRLLPAASVLRFLQRPAPLPGMLLAFGNPDLNDPGYDLPHAQQEARAVAAGLAQSRVLLRKEASKTAFRRYAGGFRFVHIASHGQFDAAAPLQSALLLAPDGDGDGRLTVGELYSLRLPADLVTLSACETGLGRVSQGDDVVGLTRGFLYAGAASIVASLWQVDDEATAQLMTRFYRALLAGADKRAALRTAQLDVLRSHRHPFYWAAFQLTGGD